MVYQPNKAIHPGITVQRTLDSLGMTQKRLAERMGLSEKHISQIINGEASITADTAFLLQNALGGSASFWFNLDKNYRETLARLEQEQRAAEEVELAKRHPYLELKKRGFVKDTRDSIEKVLELWKFYGVNSLKSVQLTESVAWRRGATEQVNVESLAAWLRCGELEAKDAASKVEIQEFNETKLKALIPKLRAYTNERGDFWSRVVNDLAGAGVILTAVEHFKGTRANGAMRWIGDNPVIQLSAYGKNADGVWFSLMHEIGHILKHGRKQKHISFVKGKEKSPTENEADAFASETLIPQKDFDLFVVRGDFSQENIRLFAEAQGIDPGIVVGRLKISGIIDFRDHTGMHRKLKIEAS